MDAQRRVLVTYSTAAGSTEGIAERIATTLRAAGTEVVCRPAGPDADPGPFDAFVIGSAVHNMAWLQPALDLVRRAHATGRPVWCVSVGGIQPRNRLTRGMTDRELRRIEQAFPGSFVPRDHRMFGGIIDMQHTPRGAVSSSGRRGGRPGDHRDWAAIDAWTAEIATDLAGRAPVADRSASGRRESGTAPSSRT